MKFDELVGIIDDAEMDVYCTTETDWHKTLYEGPDSEFSYDRLPVDIQDMEIYRVWVADDKLNVCVDVPPETWDEKEESHEECTHNLEGITMDGVVLQEVLVDQSDGDATKQMLRMVTGCDCLPLEGSTASSPMDGTEGGSIDFYCCDDFMGYTISYDYKPLGNGLCRLVGTAITPNELYDHYFDLTRDSLRELLSSMAADNYDRRTLRVIGEKFGMLV